MAPGSPTPIPSALVVLGQATAEEVAALVVVLGLTGAGSTDGEGRPMSSWSSRRSLLRGRHDPGPTAWVATHRA